jgi:hypothetical protein
MWQRAKRWVAVALCALGGVACGDGDEPATGDGAAVRFELSDGVPDFGDVPFPSDLYRDAEGRVAFGAFPNPRSDDTMFAAVRELLATRSGFCTSCNVTFAVDGQLAAGSLPDAEQLRSQPGWERGVALVDVDPDSPELGQALPLRLQWDAERGLLALRPARGFVLAAGRRYAAVVTDALQSPDGSPLQAAPDFAALRDGIVLEGVSEARAAQAHASVESALATLEGLGLPRQRVVGLASFVTDDPSREPLALREAVQAGAPPTITVDRVYSGSAIDELLGVPAASEPGADRPSQAGSEGPLAVVHDTTAFVIRGHFSAPRFVEGSGSDVGATTRGDDGLPESRAVDAVPFVLIVPRDVDLARLPVLLSHHGFNASRTTGFTLADTAGRAGYAVLAIDAYQHGDRAESAKDELNMMRGGIEGGDGFAESDKLQVSGRTFGLFGGDEALALYPGYPLGAFQQFSADAMSALRMLRESPLDALRAAEPALASLTFDADRIAYVGNSMGSVVGMSVLVAEPTVRAAVLDVMPGSVVETLAESGEFRGLSTALLLPQIGVHNDFDEVERAMLFEPTVDLMRWVLEPVDPLALAPFVARMRREEAGATPDLLIQLAGHDEIAPPTASESAVAAAGVPGVGAFSFAPVEPTSLPLAAQDATLAAVRFEGAMHGMMEVHEQASHYQAPLLQPLVKRPASTELINPVAAVHTQIEIFLRTFAEDGHATIAP